ncbi:TPA: lysis protein, partial [Pseudomonas aeruginosa]|nr:lysis protein [Pseudomonas aeruginosa]
MAVLSLLRTSTFWLVLSAVLCGAAVV